MTDDKHVDESWKEQAKAEKEKDPEPESLPPPDFAALVTSLATHALMSLGALPDPEAKPVAPDLDRARYSIDLLDMLAAKTKGNLSPGEDRHLAAVLHELHMAFVESKRNPKA